MTYKPEKIALLVLAGIAIVGLIVLAVATLRAHTIDPNASALIGVVATGLIAFAKDIVQAIRSYTTGDQMNRMSDQLAKAAPPRDGPQAVVIEQPSDQPVPVSDKGTEA